MVTLEEKAARIAFWLATSLERVESDAVVRLLDGIAEAAVYEIEPGLYQVDLVDIATGRRGLVVILAESPGWASPVVYLSHSIVDLEAFNGIYERFSSRIRQG